MDDLIAFLRAQFDEDEQTSQYAGVDCWHECGDADLAHHDRFDSARVLRAVETGRRLVDEYADALRVQGGFRETGYEEGRREALELACRLRAQEYADHDDYQERWKP
ncbi:DUF6221 family protein [Nonomuraea guangzhouensis]|uniref:DUF6221 family protein n=1 Tax=Nonomuraea guangzhouensis TaxID=1291555 RepID=A0ABW4GWW1_9ACTN|nr:DUF6221 family protein [Nonomuraea guangzhouensis]